MFYIMLYLYAFCYLCMGRWPIVKQTFELEHDPQTPISVWRNLMDQMSGRLIKSSILPISTTFQDVVCVDVIRKETS